MHKKRICQIIIMMLICSSFLPGITIVDSVIINPGVHFLSGNENYTVDHAMNFSLIRVNNTWIRFNTSDFNISSPADINITLSFINQSLTTTGDGDRLLNFTANVTGSPTVHYNISGFIPNDEYNVTINGVNSTRTANAQGYIYFTTTDSFHNITIWRYGSDISMGGGWGWWRLVTIDHDFIDAPLVDFPILFVINASIGANCHEGDSIRFYNLDNITQYSHEVELWNTTSNSYIWIKIPYISDSVDTYFGFFYGNPSLSDAQDVDGVWNNDFIGVYHMNDTTDSTYRDKDWTRSGAGYTTGKIAGCYDFEYSGSPDYGYVTDFYDCEDNTTIEAWIALESLGPPGSGNINSGVHLNQANNYNNSGLHLRVKTTNDNVYQASVRMNGTQTTAESITTVVQDNTVWRYLVGLYTETNCSITVNTSVNESFEADTTNFSVFATNRLDFARFRPASPRYLDGRLDEIRISKVLRNESWTNASFHTQNQSTGFITISAPVASSTGVNPPTGFTAVTLEENEIDLNWTRDDTADYTYIRRKTGGYPTNIFDGTFVYNGTQLTYVNSGLQAYTIHYYRAWNYNSTSHNYSVGSSTTYNNTGPQNPTNVIGLYFSESLNITWTIGNYATRTTIAKTTTGTYAIDPFDGTQIYNGTGTYFNESDLNETNRYMVYSWNQSTKIYSSGVQVYWGALGLNCFNESNASQAIWFDIEISNQNGSQVYTADNINNTHWLSLAQIPYGTDTMFFLSNSSYQSRTYYYNILENQVYNFSFYLPPVEQPPPGGGGGGEENVTTRLYTLQVIDEYLYPIADADVIIKRELGEGEYTTVAKLITNGYGKADVWLIPGVHYKVEISSSGYDTDVFDWTTDPVYYGELYPEIFQLTASAIDTEDIITFWDIVTFNGTMSSGGQIQVTFIVSQGNTTNAQFYTYELFNGSAILNATNTTTSNSFSFYVTGCNESREHRIILHLNHSLLGYEIVSIVIRPYRDTKWDAELTEEIIEDVGGEFELGWVRTFFVFIPAIGLLVIPGKDHPGFGIIISGAWMGFMGVGLGIPVEHWVIAPFIVAIGILLIVVKGGTFKL